MARVFAETRAGQACLLAGSRNLWGNRPPRQQLR